MLAGMTESPPEEPPITLEEMSGLPGPIATDLLEAGACLTFGAYRAAALLGRRAVEQGVVMRRVPLEMKTLHQKLVWLLQGGHLPRHLAGHARIVGDVGTAAAHGGEALSREEAHAMVVSSLAVARGVLAPGD